MSSKTKKTVAPQGVRCQKCLQHGHWSYECKNPPKYVSRETHTKQLSKVIKQVLNGKENYSSENKVKGVKRSHEKEKQTDKKKKKKKDESESSSDSESSSSSSSSSSSGSSSSSSGSSSESEEDDKRRK